MSFLLGVVSCGLPFQSSVQVPGLARLLEALVGHAQELISKQRKLRDRVAKLEEWKVCCTVSHLFEVYSKACPPSFSCLCLFVCVLLRSLTLPPVLLYLCLLVC